MFYIQFLWILDVSGKVYSLKRKSVTMAMLDLRAALVLCCFLQLGRLLLLKNPYVCPPEFPHQSSMLSCHSYNEEYLTFDEAQVSCIAKGGKLIEPNTYSPNSEDLHYLLYFKDEGYWVGITDSANPGVWAYASDNSPVPEKTLEYVIIIEDVGPLHGRQCLTYRSDYPTDYHPIPCEEKARSVCQYVPPAKVCAVRHGGLLIPFNGRSSSQYVSLPCDYTMASIVCGDYDVRVYGTNEPVGLSKDLFTPVSARVIVQRATTQETMVSAQVNREAIAKSKDGKNLWTVTDGAWSEEVRETFEPARQAAVIKIGDVGQVDFSASKDKIEYGLYVRCKDVRSSVEFPETICEYMQGTSDWSRQIRQGGLHPQARKGLFMRAVFLQNVGKQLQCSALASKVSKIRGRPDAQEAVTACSVAFSFRRLTKCFAGEKVWFDICLDAFVGKNVDKCKELKAKIADCGPPRLGHSRAINPFTRIYTSC